MLKTSQLASHFWGLNKMNPFSFSYPKTLFNVYLTIFKPLKTFDKLKSFFLKCILNDIKEFLKPENVANAPMILLFIGSHGKQGS